MNNYGTSKATHTKLQENAFIQFKNRFSNISQQVKAKEKMKNKAFHRKL